MQQKDVERAHAVLDIVIAEVEQRVPSDGKQYIVIQDPSVVRQSGTEEQAKG